MKIFLAAPISGFDNIDEYKEYRNRVILLIKELRKLFCVCSELEKVDNIETYDSPEKSVKKDFQAIEDSDVFLLLHPHKMQTSSFIELGYAYALNKKILIIAEKEELPYMALGLCTSERTAIIVSPQESYVGITRILKDWE
jgi:nucleoside 2-deoxyribosyltransferase